MMKTHIDEVIRLRQRLRELISEPGRLTSHKANDHIDSLAEAMVAHGALVETAPEMQAIIERDGQTRMY